MALVAAIELNSVGKFFESGKEKIEVIKDITLSVDEGRFVCVVGPSGCGKTTLLRLISGILRPQKGQISVGRTG
ncbi:MAG: ATP-binding cassette domain-containing protein, partial [Candidatus Methanosuratincola sp.]